MYVMSVFYSSNFDRFCILLFFLLECTILKAQVDDVVVKDKLQKILKDAPDREGGTRWAKKKEKKKKD